ncbi:MAG: hypothetical protein NVS2B14_13810 [Chamaesiphon sp.]
MVQCWFPKLASAQTQKFCQRSKEEIAQKENLLKGSLQGKEDTLKSYPTLIKQHGNDLQQCRSITWPNTQSIWLQLYPCDNNPGVLDEILDRVVNHGYNQVNIKVFGHGKVLLPQSDNQTAWASVLHQPGAENADLLAQAIEKGHERGLKVYAWMYTMNFGQDYGNRPDRESVLAHNGKAQTALVSLGERTQAYIDPYNEQAKSVETTARRHYI